MSLLRKLFGTATADEEITAAEKLLDEGDPGSAKLRFERALSKTSNSDQRVRGDIEKRISDCCDEIARGRLREANDLLVSGHRDLAEEEIHGALEVAVDGTLREELQDFLERSDRDRLVGTTAANQAPSAPTNFYAEMRSSEPTEEDQALEYDTYGSPFEQALHATFRGDVANAIEQFQALLSEAKDPRYLHYELALAYRLDEQTENARKHFGAFLSRIAPDEGGVARIQAHHALASYMLDQDDPDGAIEEMQKAVEALPHSPAAYHELGNVLRRCGHPNEAADVLRAALDLDGGDHWMMRQALGLALVDAGDQKAAQLELEQVVNIFVEREDLRLPIEAAEALAQIFEVDEQFTKAADLYRMLCEGASGESAARFHLHAGRLLAQAGKTEAASTMLRRAKALADEYELPKIAGSADEHLGALASS